MYFYDVQTKHIHPTQDIPPFAFINYRYISFVGYFHFNKGKGGLLYKYLYVL